MKKMPNKLGPFLWYFLKKYKVSFCFYVFFTIFVSDVAMLFLQPYLLKVFFDKINNETITISNGLWLIAGIVCSDIHLPTMTLLNIFKFHSITKTIEDIRSKMFSYSIKQSVKFFNSNYSGELVGKINAITNSLSSVSETIFEILKNLFLLLALVFVLFYFNVALGLCMLLWFVLYCLVTYNYLIKKGATQSKLIQQEQNKILAFITDSFINIENIKAFSSEKREKQQLVKLLGKKFKKVYFEVKYQKIIDGLYFILNFSISCFIILVAVFQLKDGIIEIGSFVFLVDIIRRFLIFSKQICWNFRSFKDVAIMSDSLDLITNDIEIKDKKDAKKLETNMGKIVFKNISFRY